MAEPKEPAPVMLIVAAFSRSLEVIGWAERQLAERFGPVILHSPLFEFQETRYYEQEMGPGLQKKFYAFQRLIHPDALADVKLATNELERMASEPDGWAARLTGALRPLNLDPGILSAGKWMLATTKDQAHRVYLGNGIYAEVTLRFEQGDFVPWPWTYPNYARADYRCFFRQARAEYLRLLKASTPCG